MLAPSRFPLIFRLGLPVVAILLAAFSRTAHAADADSVSFKRDVAPLLVQRGQACHGPDKSKGKYRLDTFERLMKPGSSDAAPIASGKPDQSELLRLIQSHDEDERMPKKGDRLSDAEAAKIRKWIEQGAGFDGPDRKAALEGYLPIERYPSPPEVYPRPVPIAALAFGGDGKEIFAGGYHEITVWDATSGKLLRRIGDLPQRTQCLAMSADGSLLAFAGGTPGKVGEVRLIDPSSGLTVKVLDRIGDLMMVARFSPDGSRLAAGGSDNTIRVYDVKGGKRLLLIEQHADWITDLAFSPDGKHLASASRDKSSRIFDSSTGEMTEAYVDQENPISAIGWRDDGKSVISADRGHVIHEWSVTDGKKASEFDDTGTEVFRIVTAPGKLFMACADQKVREFSQGKYTAFRTYPSLGDLAFSLAVDAKDGRVAAGSYGGQVKVWQIEDGKEIASFVAAPGYVGGQR